MITERTTRDTRGIINNYANFGDNDVGCMHRGALPFSFNSLSSASLSRAISVFSLFFVLLSYLLASLLASIDLSPLPPPPSLRRKATFQRIKSDLRCKSEAHEMRRSTFSDSRPKCRDQNVEGQNVEGILCRGILCRGTKMSRDKMSTV